MITLDKIFVKLATDSNLWLPDFSNSIAPKDAQGKNIQDTVEGYDEYCVWLLAYLKANTFFNKPIIWLK
jgi:hypothetical protein